MTTGWLAVEGLTNGLHVFFHSSHTHGSEKWIPPIVVFLSFGVVFHFHIFNGYGKIMASQPTPPNVPSPEIMVNKTLLRETNG